MIYDVNLNPVLLKEENFLASGNCAKVYKEDNYVKKVYFEYCSKNNRVDEKVYNILKNIEYPNMMKMYGLYYDYFKKNIKGYFAEYYKPDEINILEEDIYYTLNNIHNIKLLFDELSSYFIKVDDVKYLNTILQKDKIILIDPDLYRVVNCSEEDCIKYNNQKFINLFKSIYKSSIGEKIIDFKEINPYFILDDLFKVNSNIIEDEIAKKLTKYKYPIEYFKVK